MRFKLCRRRARTSSFGEMGFLIGSEVVAVVVAGTADAMSTSGMAGKLMTRM